MRSNVLSESLKPWLHSAKYRAECGIISRRPRYVPGRIMTHLVASNCWTGCLIAGCLVFMRTCLMNIVNMTHSGRLEKSTATKTGSWFQHHKSDLHKQGFVYGLMRVSSNELVDQKRKEENHVCRIAKYKGDIIIYDIKTSDESGSHDEGQKNNTQKREWM